MRKIIIQGSGVLLLLTLSVVGYPQKHLSLPDIGDPSYATMSLSKEKKLGRIVLAKLRGSLRLVQPIELQDYLNSVGYRVLSYSADSALIFYFLMVQSDAINAFATPGGVIAVNSGLIMKAASEDEVAGVIAHEISHIQHRHIARLYALSDQTQWLSTLQLIASLIAAAYNPQLGQLSLAAAASNPVERYLSYSRVFEKEADYSGIRLLYRAGYNPYGMVSFFSKLQSQGRRGNSRVPEFLSTHPLGIDRLSRMQQRSQEYPRRAQHNGQDFAYAKAALQAVSETKTEYPEEPPHIGLYRKGVRLMERGFSYAALQTFHKIEKAYRDNKMVGIAIAKALTLQNHNPQAEETLRRLSSLYPESVSIAYYLAKLLLNTQRPRQAQNILKSVDALQHNYPQLIQLHAAIAAALKKPILNHEYLSDYYYTMGKIDLALQQLKLADAAAKSHPIAQKRIEEKRKRILKLKQEMEE